MESGYCDIEEIVWVFEERLPSRAVRYVAEQMGLDLRVLSERGIDDASAAEKLRSISDIHEAILSAVEIVLLMYGGSLSTNDAFSLVDDEFRGENNPLTSAAWQLLHEELE